LTGAALVGGSKNKKILVVNEDYSVIAPVGLVKNIIYRK